MATYKQCKYCLQRIQEDEFDLYKCTKCSMCAHQRCCSPNTRPNTHLKGDYLFVFECRECSYERTDTFTRMKLMWVQLIHLALYNLTISEPGRHGYFRWKDDVVRFIDRHWSFLMPGRSKPSTMSGTIAGVLSIHDKLFKSGSQLFNESGWWALQTVAPPITNLENYKMFRSASNLSQSQSHGNRKTAAAAPPPQNDEYGRGKRQRNIKGKKKENVAAKIVKIEGVPGRNNKNNSNSTTNETSTAHSDSGNNTNAKNNTLKQRVQQDKVTETKTECSKMEEASSGNLLQVRPSQSSNSVAVKAEPVTYNSYDQKVARENGLFPMEEKNPFSMEYSPEDIADYIPSMFDEKSEFDQIVEEFKEYNAQKHDQLQETCVPKLEEKSDIVKKQVEQYPGSIGKVCAVKQVPIEKIRARKSVEIEEVYIEPVKVNIKTECERDEKEEFTQEVTMKEETKEDCSSKALLSVKDEVALLWKLNEFEFVVNADASVRRLRRKLLVRKMKRERGLDMLNLQQSCETYALKDAPDENINFPNDVKVEVKCEMPAQNFASQSLSGKHAYHHPALRDVNVLDRFFNFPQHLSNNDELANKSVHVRLVGNSEDTFCSRSITSPYTARVLKPYIRRDFQSLPRKLKLSEEIRQHKRTTQRSDTATKYPIDYCYVQPDHLPAVNALCSEFFWPGIEMTEALHYPEFSCVVLYRKLVVGFAFMVPDIKYNEAYISFILVHPDWQRASIGTNMLYHLIQTCMGKDITLHVSPTNPSLIFYQKFGFKAEKLLLGFYEKYMPEGDATCPHALVLRLRR